MASGTANSTTYLAGNGTWASIGLIITNTAAAYTWSNVHTFNANVSLAGNATSILTIGVVSVNSTVISVGNSTVFTSVNSTAFSGTANNATYLSGATLSTIQNQITGNAATAYTNAVAYADSRAATAYSNAISIAAADATNKADAAYSNAVAQANLLAATAYTNAYVVAVNGYTNAITTADQFASNAYVNAVAQATTLAGTAYSNAVAFASNASNISTGTLAEARLPATTVNTSASFTLGGSITFGAGLFEKAVALGAGSSMNLNSGTYFSKTVNSATTFAASGVPAAGNVASFTLELTNGGSNTITWMTGTKWAGGSPPSLTSSGIDVLVFTTRDGGTSWLAAPAILNAA